MPGAVAAAIRRGGTSSRPGVAMAKGRSFHVGVAHNFEQKIGSGIDLKPGDMVDAAVADFSDNADDIEDVTAADKGDAVDELVDLVVVHAKKQAPDYQPTMVEESIRVELSGPRDLLAIIDVADTQDRVTDFKTGEEKQIAAGR